MNLIPTINCKGKLINLSSPKVMGILNITPDSFFDGGRYTDRRSIKLQVENMLKEGATFIDIGACSSRPFAKSITKEEELKRIVPVVKLLLSHFPGILISIDTFRSEVAQICIEEGVCMVNDISGGDLDSGMFETIARFQVPYVITHMQGIPETMQNSPIYKDVVTDVFYNLSKKLEILNRLHVNDILLDVGFGFGKTLIHNFELLKNLDYFNQMELPILVGISRKSMLYKTLNITEKEALNATSVANTIALMKGAKILRVHDVRSAIEAIAIFNSTFPVSSNE